MYYSAEERQSDVWVWSWSSRERDGRAPGRRPRRPLPHRARARPGRHGHGLSRRTTSSTTARSRSRSSSPSSAPCSAPSGSWPRSRSPPTCSTPTCCRCSTPGEADGLLYYVMPYVEGETLRARLEREQQLPVDETIRLRHPAGRRARLRPRPRRHPSRPQAGEHPAPGRPAGDRRLRHRAGRGQGRRHPRHRDRALPRHPALHESRAGLRRAGPRRALRPVLPGGGDVRDAHRRAAPHRRHRAGHRRAADD